MDIGNGGNAYVFCSLLTSRRKHANIDGATAFEVLDSQTRLANSESALLNAYVTYQEAFVDYQRATWTLLDGLGMVLELPKVR